MHQLLFYSCINPFIVRGMGERGREKTESLSFDRPVIGWGDACIIICNFPMFTLGPEPFQKLINLAVIVASMRRRRWFGNDNPLSCRHGHTLRLRLRFRIRFQSGNIILLCKNDKTTELDSFVVRSTTDLWICESWVSEQTQTMCDQIVLVLIFRFICEWRVLKAGSKPPFFLEQPFH